MKDISHEDYQIRYDPEAAAISCAGILRLRGEDYALITELLNEAADAAHPSLTLDVRKLQFLNSSGINTLSKFILRMRQQPESTVTVKGSGQFPWQRRSLTNLQRLLPSIQLEFEDSA